jgi:hypothetical protein
MVALPMLARRACNAQPAEPGNGRSRAVHIRHASRARAEKAPTRGIIRLDFPGFSGQDSLEEISWDEFFESFDKNGLALIYQEKTAGGKPSNFNKLVKR